jgi:predicted metalloprotease with PDZ domain
VTSNLSKFAGLILQGEEEEQMPRRTRYWMTAKLWTLPCLAGLLLSFLCPVGLAQTPLKYDLRYAAPGDHLVSLTITLPAGIPAPVTLVMPRAYPGGYSEVLYDSYVENVTGVSQDGETFSGVKDEYGPRWSIGGKGETVASIQYQVDVAAMESHILAAVDTSKVRPGYVGLLGYSVFAYLDGMENDPISLQITAPEAWPVLTTLEPRADAPKSTAHARAPDYYALADSEVLLGPDLQLRKLDGKIDLLMAVYSEGEEDIAADAQLAREALDRVQAYFGDTPFRTYTVQLELLRPLPGHDYDFSQEHVDSGTFSFSLQSALTARSSSDERQINLFNYAHHMAHSWIPKRAYGVGYRPFTWEMAPIIDTIWFNEGFGRYAAIQALVDGMSPADGKAFREEQLSGLRHVLAVAPSFIRQMPLLVLSREASLLYSADFRTGSNIFSRGALMASQMDDRIRQKTHGAKSLRDGLRAMLAWTDRNHKPFQIDDLPAIITNATGVKVDDILARWMAPQP